MPKLIEIIGPPGSGKTFFSSHLENLNTDHKKRKIFFHSSNNNNLIYFKKINFFIKIMLKFKVIFYIIFFYFFFGKRIFLKKIYYKRKFFLRVLYLNYIHLIYIEFLKKYLSKDNYLIMEPGPIMYFLQDYFYTKTKIPELSIKIFNRFFLNIDYIIYLDCNPDLKIKRLNSRQRGLPQRMKDLKKNELLYTIKNSSKIIKKYIQNKSFSKFKTLKIDSSKSFEKNMVKISNFLEFYRNKN